MKHINKSTRNFLFIPLIAVCLSLAGCAPNAPEPPKSCEAVAAAIASGQAFDELTPQDLPEIVAYMGLEEEDLTDAALWMDASAASVEMVAVLTAKDSAALKRLQEEVNGFRKDMTETYRDYAPEELPKLQDAVLEIRGLQLVFISSKDPAAAKTSLDAAWKP